MFLKFQEYKRKYTRLSDYFLMDVLVHDCVVQNKDGSLMSTFCYRGPDLDSATQLELKNLRKRANNVLKRNQGGWAIYSESQRIRSKNYIKGEHFPDPITKAIDDERADYFSQGNHYESHYYFTLVYLPEPDRQSKFKNMFIEGQEQTITTGEEHLKYFIDEGDKIYSLLQDALPDGYLLTGDGLLTYLHSCISPYRHPVITPEEPLFLSEYLGSEATLIPGMKPQLGDKHLRVISIYGFPNSTVPGIFDNLNRLNFEFRWVTRFICLDKEEAAKEIKHRSKVLYTDRKSMGMYAIESMTGSESARIDLNAVDKADDADLAKAETENDLVAYGYYTFTVVVMDENLDMVEKKAKAILTTVHSLGFTGTIETINAVDAWFGSIPGMCYCNDRKFLVHTANLVDMMPISAIWAGPEKNEHLNGPPLLYTETSGYTPYRLDLHRGNDDLSHTTIVGPPGSGKSVLMELVGVAGRKYKNSQTYIFDKGGSSRVTTYGVGGNFYDLGKTGPNSLAFQPMVNVEDPQERSWLFDWICAYMIQSGITLNPKRRDIITNALTRMIPFAKEYRDMTAFKTLLASDDEELAQALNPITEGGPHGYLFDSKEDHLGTGSWQVFEMETIMKTSVLVPALSYLFHRIEQRLDGRPTYIELDECWTYFKHEIFVSMIENWLKTARKYNTTIIFATQSLGDIVKSPIVETVLDACPNRIFLANPNASNEQNQPVYELFGLNSREIDIVSSMIPKKQYYYKSDKGSRNFELALGPIALAYCAATSKESQVVAETLYQEHGKSGFNKAWLKHNGLNHIAQQLYKEA